MSSQPIRILLSGKALEACGAEIKRVIGNRPFELLASETAGSAPDADIAFVTRDVIGKSARNLVHETTQRFFDQMRDSPGLIWLQLNAAGADRPIYLEMR